MMVWQPSKEPGLLRPAQCDALSSEAGTPSLNGGIWAPGQHTP